MSKFDWRALVQGVAPTIATALGGPLTGAAVAAVGRAVLGKEGATETEISNALANAQPQDIAKLKEADNEFRLEMERLGVDLERLANEDRDSARRREINLRDWTPRVLAFAILLAFFAMAGGVLFGELKATDAMAGAIIGYLSAKAEQVVAYYFGSSAGSKQKTQIMGGK